MTAAVSLNPGAPAATPVGQHELRLLAARLISSLADGRGLALVTGEPPPELTRLAQAIGIESAGRHLVIAAACGPEFSGEGLLRIAQNAVSQHGRAAGEASAGAIRPLLFVLQRAERLTVAQIEELYAVTTLGRGFPAAAVLVGSGSFRARLATPGLRFLREGARSCLDALGAPLPQPTPNEPAAVAAAETPDRGELEDPEVAEGREEGVAAAESAFPDRQDLPLLLAASENARLPKARQVRSPFPWLKTAAYALLSAGILGCLLWLVPSLATRLSAHLGREPAGAVTFVGGDPRQGPVPTPPVASLPISLLSADAPLSVGALAADAPVAERSAAPSADGAGGSQQGR